MTQAHAPQNVNDIQWHQAMGYARSACARIFRDGGAPKDALEAFGLKTTSNTDWAKAVERITETLCQPQTSLKRAA